MSAPLPPLAPGAVPADVRAAGPQAVDQFRAALSFERVLLTTLLEEALPEQESPLPTTASMTDLLADAIVADGGAGIAVDLARGPAAGAGG